MEKGRMVCPNCEVGSEAKRLIDADALIAYFEEQYNVAMDDPDPVSGYVMSALRCCIEHFKTIPTVDAVEVVHGRWVEIPSLLDLPWKKYRCDHCGCPQDYKHNYCPNCGAKMDGDVNG